MNLKEIHDGLKELHKEFRKYYFDEDVLIGVGSSNLHLQNGFYIALVNELGVKDISILSGDNVKRAFVHEGIEYLTLFTPTKPWVEKVKPEEQAITTGGENEIHE